MLGDCHFCYHINSTKFIIRMHLRMCLEVLLKTGALIRLATKPFGRVELDTMGRFLWWQLPFTSCRWQAGVRVWVRSLVLNILCPIFLLTNQQFHTLYPWHIDIFHLITVFRSRPSWAATCSPATIFLHGSLLLSITI